MAKAAAESAQSRLASLSARTESRDHPASAGLGRVRAADGDTGRCGRPRRAGDLLGRALGHHAAAGVAGLGPQIDDPVGPLHDVEVVLDDHHGVARVHQAVEHLDQHPDVVEVEAGGGLVEDVELPAVALAGLGQLAGDLEPLGLAARQRGRRLAQPQVAEPHLLELPQRGAQLGLVPEPA